MKFLVVLSALCAVALGGTPRLNGRIVGGSRVSILDYPYQVSVRIYDQHICGGTIIDAKTILTAAHCVYGMDQTRYSVRVGNTYHEDGESYEVHSITMNADYDPDATNNDMAILKLKNSLKMKEGVQAIALQSDGSTVPANTTAWVSGWGALFEGSENTPDDLRAVDVTVITNEDCARKYASETITEQMMCCQTVDHDSCQGDSGGPLVANGALAGVVSWGYGCARPKYPGVYASVGNMRSWIEANRK